MYKFIYSYSYNIQVIRLAFHKKYIIHSYILHQQLIELFVNLM